MTTCQGNKVASTPQVIGLSVKAICGSLTMQRVAYARKAMIEQLRPIPIAIFGRMFQRTPTDAEQEIILKHVDDLIDLPVDENDPDFNNADVCGRFFEGFRLAVTPEEYSRALLRLERLAEAEQ